MDVPQEGSLYKTLDAYGRQFEIRYGYYSETERERWEPTPIFPNFLKDPQYTPCGLPFATAEQDVCGHYQSKPHTSGEDWCNDCIHYHPVVETIGVCKCKDKRLPDKQNE